MVDGSFVYNILDLGTREITGGGLHDERAVVVILGNLILLVRPAYRDDQVWTYGAEGYGTQIQAPEYFLGKLVFLITGIFHAVIAAAVGIPLAYLPGIDFHDGEVSPVPDGGEVLGSRNRSFCHDMKRVNL